MFEKEARCRLLSHPAHPPHYLSYRCNPLIRHGCFTCNGKYTVRSEDYVQYYCNNCDVEFHVGCHKHPRRITHPYHPQHPLTLFYRNLETGITTNIIPEFNPSNKLNSYDREFDDESDVVESAFVDIVPSESDIIFEKCTWCGSSFKGDWFYRCLICSFCLDIPCAETILPLTIANPKTHQHPLLFSPRPLLGPCDGCGLVDAVEPSYTCFQCNYMVHRNCMDLPRVIKITRHPHRLSYVPYRSPMRFSCKICYKDVDIKYGQYTCNHQGCASYVAHSKCATHPNVWDGAELEWEAEESEEKDDDISPFWKLGDGLIQHFCHEQHPLKLKKHDGVGDTEKQCRACVFPILTHQFYHCEECDYSLHEICAGLSRKLDHALHNHTLTLNPPPLELDDESKFSCSACIRSSTGFRYKCSNKDCRSYIMLDVGCISVQEHFTHKSHEHPIFLSTFYNWKDTILCRVCKERRWGSHLQCTVCEFTMCYTCATIPNTIHYRFDKHPLTLCCGESTDDDMYWCEMCEKQLDPREWFYTCNECCITIHIQCLFGSSCLMKSGSRFPEDYGTVTVFHNTSNTRKFCHGCDQRCTDQVYYEGEDVYSIWPTTHAFCSLKCVRAKMRRYA